MRRPVALVLRAPCAVLAAIALLPVVPCPVVAEPAATSIEQAVRDAVARSVLQRLQASADVSVEVLRMEVRVRAVSLTAIPAAGARSDHAVRFALRAGERPAGYAVARVTITAPHAIATRALARGEAITAEAVAWVNTLLPDHPVDRLLTRDEVFAGAPRRAIAAFEPLTLRNVAVPPIVKSGDRVTAIVRLEGIEVSGEVVASGSGHRGDTIRILTTSGRTGRLARITAPGEVEIVP